MQRDMRFYDREQEIAFLQAEIVARDYETYSGKVLERWFKEVMREYGKYETGIAGLCMEDM